MIKQFESRSWAASLPQWLKRRDGAAPAQEAADQPAPAAALGDALPTYGEPEVDLTLEVDADDRITHISGKAIALLSSQPQSLVGSSVYDLVPEHTRSPLAKAVSSARTEHGQELQLPVLRLQSDEGDGIPTATPPLKLSLRARHDGTLVLQGLVISQGRRSSVTLGNSADRFSRIFHSSPDAILIVRQRDGIVIDFNEGFTRLLGYTREQAVGQRELDLDLWVDSAERDALLSVFTRQRSATNLEARLRTVNGETLSVEISLRYIELDGELCVLCIARDISKRLEAESAARSSEEKFAQVFTQSPDGIVILKHPSLTICDVNPAFLAGSGYSADELVGRHIGVFDPVMDSGTLQATISALTEDGRIANREMVFRRKNGNELPALVSGTLTQIDGEECLVCIVRDVSQLRHAQEQLRRSEERFRGAFENAPIGILLLDAQGQIFQANRFAAEILHYPPQALNTVRISSLVPEDERAAMQEQLARLLRASEPTFRSERRMLCANGTEIWTNCHMVLQRASNGEPLYCIMQIADITEMKYSQQRMERLAFYDTLTELANRRLFNDRLQQAVEHCRRHQERAALLYLDLDQFKRVNDTLGHESGDALLREVARRLLRCVRKEDTVGRTGGDEFTILLYDIDAPEHAGNVAAKILRELQRPTSISGHDLVITTSIGITVLPDDGLEPNQLLKNADLAMYRAKEKGRDNYQFYSEELNTNAERRLRTEYELRSALERGEFELYFQPIVRLTDYAIVAVECLIRWNHPERGLVPPDEFIGIAEDTGAIVEIGNWVIEQACAAGRLLADQRGEPLSIAVNISPRQFRDPNLVENIRRSLQQANLAASSLEVEITETMLMQDVEAAASIIDQLHQLGIRLAIDDFGTGYSSLNYLKKFPISTVKVDRSFIADIPASSDDTEITAAVIAMAHRLKLNVVAEGVETQEQLEFLVEQRCDYAQGYLFSRALTLEDTRVALKPNLRLLHNRS
ncbi:MAG: EAL domain-containing protein [Pseudomonadales bacterium]